MEKKRQCVDIYGEPLQIGDRVIPVLSQAAIIGIEGIISDIIYSDEYHNYYITITNNEGNILLKNVNARYYTTEERFDLRENSNYVYSLRFYDKELQLLTFLPLVDKTDANYIIPQGTYVITLCSKHTRLEPNGLITVMHHDLYNFSVQSKVEYKYIKQYKSLYLRVIETEKWCHIYDNEGRKYFETEEALQNFITKLITYFNHVDLKEITNKIDNSENMDSEKFEKKLIRKLRKDV